MCIQSNSTHTLPSSSSGGRAPSRTTACYPPSSWLPNSFRGDRGQHTTSRTHPTGLLGTSNQLDPAVETTCTGGEQSGTGNVDGAQGEGSSVGDGDAAECSDGGLTGNVSSPTRRQRLKKEDHCTGQFVKGNIDHQAYEVLEKRCSEESIDFQVVNNGRNRQEGKEDHSLRPSSPSSNHSHHPETTSSHGEINDDEGDNKQNNPHWLSPNDASSATSSASTYVPPLSEPQAGLGQGVDTPCIHHRRPPVEKIQRHRRNHARPGNPLQRGLKRRLERVKAMPTLPGVDEHQRPPFRLAEIHERMRRDR